MNRIGVGGGVFLLGGILQGAMAAAPRDVPYPGTMTLQVDATDRNHRVYRVQEEIPVKAGELTLYYPHWVAGFHATQETVEDVAGLKLTVPGKSEPLTWKRDPLDVYAFHVTVPPAAHALQVDFQFLSFGTATPGPELMSSGVLVVPWQTLVLYPGTR